MDFRSPSVKNTFILWLLLMLHTEKILDFFYEIFSFFGISCNQNNVPKIDLVCSTFWRELTRKNFSESRCGSLRLDYTRTAPWYKSRIKPYCHPPTRMELDRKYRGLNDTKITGIESYVNRNQDIANQSD